MTKKEIIQQMIDTPDDNVVIIGDENGWCNIDKIEQTENCIKIIGEKYSIFSDN